MLTTTLALFAILGNPSAPALTWEQVGKNAQESISGIVRWGEANGDARFIIVLDNKGTTQTKIAWVTKSANAWKMSEIKLNDPKKLATDANGDSLVKDLEAVCRVPGVADEVLAIGDRDKAQGWLYRFKIDGNQAILQDTFVVPNVGANSDYEALDLYPVEDSVVAVWGDRGADSRPGILSCASINFSTRNGFPFGEVSTLAIKVAWPTLVETRSISDVRISRSGEIYVSSACDPDDKGPFDSAVYIVGRLGISKGIPFMTPFASHVLVSAVPGRKIEAIDFDSSGTQLVFGTDEEAFGGWIAWYQK